jgi:hypothetical protein
VTSAGLDLTVRSTASATIIRHAQKVLESVMNVRIILKVNSVTSASSEVMEMQRTVDVCLVTVMDMQMKYLECVIRGLGR